MMNTAKVKLMLSVMTIVICDSIEEYKGKRGWVGMRYVELEGLFVKTRVVFCSY